MIPINIQIRFSDIDSMGHVNNAVYLNYFEYARVSFFSPRLGTNWDWRRFGIILKKNEIEYHKPVLLGQIPEIRMFLVNIGSKSFTLGYELCVNSEICTTGSSVLVGFDSVSNVTIEIPIKMREILAALNEE
jgi:acyl-CoA thioester hydrolase